MHFQNAIPRLAKRPPVERDYTAWLGFRALADAAMKSGKVTPQEVKAYMLSDAFKLEGFRGQAMSFRTWDHQMRQPVVLGGGTRVPVSTSRRKASCTPPTYRHAWLRQTGDQVQVQVSIEKGRSMIRILLAAASAATLCLRHPVLRRTLIFVSNEKNNTVTVLNADTLETVKTIKVARRPRGIVVSRTARSCSWPPATATSCDVDRCRHARSLAASIRPDPELMAIDPAGKVIDIANEDDSLVTIMDIKSGDILAEVPVGVSLRAWASARTARSPSPPPNRPGMAHVIDNTSQQADRRCAGRQPPREAKFTPDGKELWVSSEVGAPSR